MAKQGDLFRRDLTAHAHPVFLFRAAVRTDQGFGQHPILGEDQEPPGILVQPAQRRQPCPPARRAHGAAMTVLGGQQAHGRGLAGLGRAGNIAYGLVEQDRDLCIERFRRATCQRSGLTGGNPVSRIGHDGALDGDLAVRDQGIGLTPGADAFCGQPFV